MEDKSSFLLDIATKHIGGLQGLWKTIETGYPGDYQGLTRKSEPMIRCLPLLAGEKVMDIGCNAGLYTVLAAKYAHSVVGVDPSASLIKRARLTKEYFEDNVYSAHNVRFVQGNFADHIETAGVDSVIASLVLYHLGDANVGVLTRFLTKQAKSILIQARPHRMEAFKQHPEWGRVSTTTVYNGLYRIEDCLNFLRDCGFANASVLHMDAYYHEYFPVIHARK